MREALALINQTLDEALAEQEGDFDADSRWALTWFEQLGFAEGEYGVAEQLSAPRTPASPAWWRPASSISNRGRERSDCSGPNELPSTTGTRPPTSAHRAWEMVHHLIRVLEAGGEGAAAGLASPSSAPRPKSPASYAYRLYTLCERKKARGRGTGLQRPRPELAGDRPARPRQGE